MYFINVPKQKHLSFLLLLLLVVLLLANQNQHLINLQGRRFDSTLRKIKSHLLLLEKPRTQELSDLIQDRLRHLQNPPDCSRANKILCRLSRDRCTVVLFIRTMLQFRQFFNVPNMTFSTLTIKFVIWTNIKVNIILCEMIFCLHSKELNLAHFKAYYRIYAINTNI